MSRTIYALKIKNHQRNQCFGLQFKLLLLVITYKCYLNKGDGFGAVHKVIIKLSLLFVLFSDVSAV